jgi:glycosyltransferase involved in cell wall biosynthesis
MMESTKQISRGRIKVLQLITGLDVGGAERMLQQLVARIDRDRFDVEVGSLLPAGSLASEIERTGTPVWSLDMKRGLPYPWKLSTLASKLRRTSPDLVHTWMYHADLMGSLSARRAGNIPVVWGVHNSSLESGVTKRSTVMTARLCARISNRYPAGIQYCSELSRRVHAEIGYRNDRTLVIPNGFDVGVFKPDPEARAGVRTELGLPGDSLIIGLVARFDPSKDHRTFVRAAGKLAERDDDVHFMLCGKDVDASNGKLMGWVESTGVKDRFHLLGLRGDIPRLSAALDIATSCSRNEAFPLVVGEAMSCGVPCVVTDVGDSALLVGDTGVVVPPGDAGALCGAWRRLIDLGGAGRREMGAGARRRVADHYHVDQIVRQFENFYLAVTGDK